MFWIIIAVRHPVDKHFKKTRGVHEYRLIRKGADNHEKNMLSVPRLAEVALKHGNTRW